jgi:hypothetical protein
LCANLVFFCISSSCFSSTFRIMSSDLFPMRINLELWILQPADRTPWTGDQSCLKAATYTGHQKQKKRGQTFAPRAVNLPFSIITHFSVTVYLSLSRAMLC